VVRSRRAPPARSPALPHHDSGHGPQPAAFHTRHLHLSAATAVALLAAPFAALLAALLTPRPAAPPLPLLPFPPSSLAARRSPLGSLRINTSPSLPRGVYLLEPLQHRALRPGDLVLACPPPAAAGLALARGYLAPGPCPGGTKPLGKLVLAAAGDRLALTATAIALNRCRLPASATLFTDTRGRPLPHLAPGIHRVTTGEIWLFSPHPRSFDSRYFGPVPTTEIQGLIHPLLVSSSPPLRPWTSLLRTCAARP